MAANPALRPHSTIQINMWVLPTFLLLESFEVRFLRYVFPLMPFLILMGARMLIWMVEWGRSAGMAGYEIPPSPPLPKGGEPDVGMGGGTTSRVDVPGETGALSWPPKLSNLVAANPAVRWNLTWLPVGLVAAVLAATAFYALAFERVYAKDHPAVEASQWINANVQPGTAMVSDNHWDEFIPGLYGYQVWQFPVYEPDTPSKMSNLATRLSNSEFVVFYSNRPYSSVARDLERFPLSAVYYQRLFGGELGYRLDRTFTSYPGLAGLEFRDEPLGRAGLPNPEPLAPATRAPVSFNLGFADDNVVGYDHPRVLLFRNLDHLSEEEIGTRLGGSLAGAPRGPVLGLMLSDEERIVQQSGGTWSQIFNRDSWSNSLPVLAWLLVVELAYLAVLPLAIFVFRPLPDRGIILARILGLLGVSYVAWLSVSLGWVEFSRAPVVAGFLIVAALSATVLLVHWREITSFLRERWKLILTGEVLFLTAFLAFVAIRAANPDLWHPWRGGEKPMEFAYFNAVIRSTSLPPFDPWFAGGYLNYYYYGYFVLASLVRVTGILPATAFNLGVPLFFALTVTGAYSLVYNLTEGVRRARATAALGVGQDLGVLSSPAVRGDAATDAMVEAGAPAVAVSPPHRRIEASSWPGSSACWALAT